MKDLVSPKYQMKLVKEVEKAIWEEFETYKNVKNYINKWHEVDDRGYWENFQIIEKDNNKIDLNSTINSMSGELMLKVAIDLGVETPDFIPSIPTFKNSLKSEFKTAYDTFSKSNKLIETDPSTAIGLANSALESIIKEILKDSRLNSQIKGNETLYKLSQIILKEFNFKTESPKEIKTIGNSLISASQAIEKLRSEKTNFHGKTDDDFLINDTIYAYFIVNTVTTIGLFIKKFYLTKYPKENIKIDTSNSENDLPF
ncbi:abortive infection family protein [Mesoflavibacter zeaxanthinifaciens]|uniref:abortive infection family protein n=1 Tax=Mesoflavibacter zeaxanthinifaciens TaxID=393060 RepID=UPI003A947E44